MENTILSKLREEINKWLQEATEENKIIEWKWQLRKVLKLLDSLEKETEMEKEAICEANIPEDSSIRNSGNNKTYSQDWQPSTNEEIEVSEDGVKWESGYEYKWNDNEWYIVMYNWCTVHVPFIRKPRPLVQLPEIPYFTAQYASDFAIARQVEHLSKYLLAIDTKLRELFNNK